MSECCESVRNCADLARLEKLVKDHEKEVYKALLKQEPENEEIFPDVEGMAMNAALTVLADAVIAGKFGNGEERKEKIFRAVQDKVNELLGA